MKNLVITIGAVASVAMLAASLDAQADKGAAAVAAHKAKAAAAAGQEFSYLKTSACSERAQPAAPAAPPANQAGRGAAPASPPRDQWHAEPVKVFDNF